MKATPCGYPECSRPVRYGDLCDGHHRLRRQGVPLRPLRVIAPKGTPLADRLLMRRRVDRYTECWVWTGSIDDHGYGRIEVEGKTRYVHRVSWTSIAGRSIPKGMNMDHVCENRACFNPAHLAVVTPAVNTNSRQSAQANRTHCPQGHRYAGDNLYVYVDKDGYPHRTCRACNKRRSMEWHERHRR